MCERKRQPLLLAPLRLCVDKPYPDCPISPTPHHDLHTHSSEWRKSVQDQEGSTCLGELARILAKRKPGQRCPPTQILPHVYLGCANDAMDTDLLQRLGVTAVANCAAGYVLISPSMFPHDTLYEEFAAEDFPSYDILGCHFDDLRKFLDDVKRQGRKALVFCAQGVNRSAALCLAYYLHATGQCVVDAVRTCFEKRPIILQNEGFVDQLIHFAKTRRLPLRPQQERVEAPH